MKTIRSIINGLGLLTLTIFLHESAFSTETASSDLTTQLSAVEATAPPPAAARRMAG